MTSSAKTLLQFLKYLVAGGVAFLVDFGTLIASHELLFAGRSYRVYVAVVLAFLAGHITNYALSMWFVFTDVEERRKGLTLRAFLLFALCALFGVGVTEFGMWVGYGVMRFHYIPVKIVMAAVVFGLNFIGRKIIVSR